MANEQPAYKCLFMKPESGRSCGGSQWPVAENDLSTRDNAETWLMENLRKTGTSNHVIRCIWESTCLQHKSTSLILMSLRAPSCPQPKEVAYLEELRCPSTHSLHPVWPHVTSLLPIYPLSIQASPLGSMWPCIPYPCAHPLSPLCSQYRPTTQRFLTCTSHSNVSLIISVFLLLQVLRNNPQWHLTPRNQSFSSPSERDEEPPTSRGIYRRTQ